MKISDDEVSGLTCIEVDTSRSNADFKDQITGLTTDTLTRVFNEKFGSSTVDSTQITTQKTSTYLPYKVREFAKHALYVLILILYCF